MLFWMCFVGIVSTGVFFVCISGRSNLLCSYHTSVHVSCVSRRDSREASKCSESCVSCLLLTHYLKEKKSQFPGGGANSWLTGGKGLWESSELFVTSLRAWEAIKEVLFIVLEMTSLVGFTFLLCVPVQLFVCFLFIFLIVVFFSSSLLPILSECCRATVPLSLVTLLTQLLPVSQNCPVMYICGPQGGHGGTTYCRTDQWSTCWLQQKETQLKCVFACPCTHLCTCMRKLY